MTGNIKRRRSAFLTTVFAALPWLSSAALAQDVCVDYGAAGVVTVGASLAGNHEIQQVKTQMDSLIAAAKQGAASGILANFSKLDGSFAFEQKALKDMPDKYSSYAGLMSNTDAKGYKWGSYVLAWGDYTHQRGSAKILDSVICTNLCQVSNLMERPQENENLASRFMAEIRTNPGAEKQCPRSKPILGVYPSTRMTEANPLTFYFAPKLVKTPIPPLFRADAKAKVPVKAPTNAAACDAIAQKAGAMLGVQESEIKALSDQFLAQCATNMNERSLVPVINTATGMKKNYLTTVSLLGNLGQAKRVEQLYSFRDGQHEVQIVVFKADNNPQLLMVWPLLVSGTEKRFDWAYFGTAQGEFLLSEIFARYVEAQYGKGFH